MLAQITTFGIDGVDPYRVSVEVDIRSGLPAFTIVGLGDTAVRESRERVRSALSNSGLVFPQRRITANLAPASLRKVGPGFDAPIALAILAASGQVDRSLLTGIAVFGELSLGGSFKNTAGALAVAEGARRHGLRSLILAAEQAPEAALIEGLRVIGVESLSEALDVIAGRRRPSPYAAAAPLPLVDAPDLADVRGQAVPLLALQIAAAGGHNLLLEGPPGTGKTMLARRLPSILPPMTHQEAIEVTRLHSIVGLHSGALMTARPFRAPHHSISSVGLVGGGSPPRPGEATLASGGILFLDELAEFQRGTLDALRQPLEDGHVSIVRGRRALRFPTRFMLVAAANPCPCGYAGLGERCTCSETDINRYRRRLSGPLLDRLDMLVNVGRPSREEMESLPVIDSAHARVLVLEARERQGKRLGGTAARCNGELDARLIERTVRISPDAQAVLGSAYAQEMLSARGRHRVLRVAQTIADLAGHGSVEAADVLQALTLRQRVSPGRLHGGS